MCYFNKNTELCCFEKSNTKFNSLKKVKLKAEIYEMFKCKKITPNEFLNKIGFIARSYQENRRIQYILDNVELDIDTWPMIPTYLEIEASNEKEIYNMIEKLGLNDSKITLLNCDDIYRQIYNIDISKIKELKF